MKGPPSLSRFLKHTQTKVDKNNCSQFLLRPGTLSMSQHAPRQSVVTFSSLVPRMAEWLRMRLGPDHSWFLSFYPKYTFTTVIEDISIQIYYKSCKYEQTECPPTSSPPQKIWAIRAGANVCGHLEIEVEQWKWRTIRYHLLYENLQVFQLVHLRYFRYYTIFRKIDAGGRILINEWVSLAIPDSTESCSKSLENEFS